MMRQRRETNLSKYMIAKRVSCLKLQKMTGVFFTQISRYRQGMQIPNVAIAIRIARQLGESVYDLFSDWLEAEDQRENEKINGFRKEIGSGIKKEEN